MLTFGLTFFDRLFCNFWPPNFLLFLSKSCSNFANSFEKRLRIDNCTPQTTIYYALAGSKTSTTSLWFAKKGYPLVFRKTRGSAWLRSISGGSFKNAGDCDLSKSIKIGQQRDQLFRDAFFQNDFAVKKTSKIKSWIRIKSVQRWIWHWITNTGKTQIKLRRPRIITK
jgi:hypothetical protein